MQNNIWNKQAHSIIKEKAWIQRAFEYANGKKISIMQTGSTK